MNKKQYTGCIPSKMDLRNYRICKSSKGMVLPSSFEVRHSHIKDQGSVNSCVAHSLSEILESHDGINYSTAWIYGYRPENYYQGEGMSINNAIGTIYKVGYLKNETLDKNVEMVKAKEIVDKKLDEYMQEAGKRKISSYAYLKTQEEVKQSISQSQTPVIMAIDIDKDGLVLDDNNVAQIPIQPYGSHAVVCYGWCQKGFLIQNSWGEEWGNNGTFILPYSYNFTEAWAITFINQKSDLEMKKPNCYWLRNLLMSIIKLMRKLQK